MEAEIEHLLMRAADANRRGDAQALADLHHPNANNRQPPGEAVVGRAAIAKHLATLFEMIPEDIESETTDQCPKCRTYYLYKTDYERGKGREGERGRGRKRLGIEDRGWQGALELHAILDHLSSILNRLPLTLSAQMSTFFFLRKKTPSRPEVTTMTPLLKNG